MTVTKEENENSANVPRRRGGFWSGRSEFIVVGLLYAIGIFLAIGTAQMNVQGSASPGPRLFPILVCLVLFLSGTLLAVQILRKPNVPDNRVHPGHGEFSADMLRDIAQISPVPTIPAAAPADHGESVAKTWKTFSDWRTTSLVFGAVVLFIAILNPVGWILSATMLFWIISYALGSKRKLFDFGVAIIFASCTQLAFSAGLGLNLPSGFLGGIL
ncbi:tripartite tricarboxylate transporter TctB family protein [Paeniglutamicibacter sp. NPDC091659]|uniref:tripartite tricarboxylate transporter TctB family protein n=1 Tax=Paeniglutamicibacter sp. NPDC091659 TaxID=3364389 RepID=UPI003824782D